MYDLLLLAKGHEPSDVHYRYLKHNPKILPTRPCGQKSTLLL